MNNHKKLVSVIVSMLFWNVCFMRAGDTLSHNNTATPQEYASLPQSNPSALGLLNISTPTTPTPTLYRQEEVCPPISYEVWLAWSTAVEGCKETKQEEWLETQKMRQPPSTHLTLSSTSSQGGKTRESLQAQKAASQENLRMRRKLAKTAASTSGKDTPGETKQ